jgi:peroxiredoxin
MGMRSQRYAMIIEAGKITSINIDDKGLEKSAAEYILSLL